MPEKWAIYARISSVRQDHDLSLDAQELSCRKAAQRLGFQCEPEHIRRDSISTDETVLNVVWKAVENGEVEAIFVSLEVQPNGNTKTAEFGAIAVFANNLKDRNPLEAVAAFRRMQEVGIHIHFVDSLWGIPVEENVTVRLWVFMHPGSGDGNEPEESRPASRPNGHRVAPYGFDRNPVTGIWTVNDHEAQGVRLMFQMTAEGKSSRKTAEVLNSAGFRTKSGVRWIKNHVPTTVRKQIYNGVQIQGGVPVEGAVPRIISQELFERVQKKVDDRRAAGRYREAPFLLTGFVKCGHCDGAMLQSPRRGGPRYYRCEGRGAACHTPAVRAELLERQVWKCLREAILNPEKISLIIRLHTEGEEPDMGIVTGGTEGRKEEQNTNHDWQKVMAEHCLRVARNIDDLNQDGRRDILKELEVGVNVSRSKEGLAITVTAVFTETPRADTAG